MPVFLFAQISNPMYADGVGGGLEEVMSKFFSYEERLELQKYAGLDSVHLTYAMAVKR